MGTAYTTTMGGKIKIGYEVIIGGMDSSDGSRQGQGHIQRMLMTAGGISGRLLAMFLETQDDGGSASLHTVTTNGGIKVTYEVMVDMDSVVNPNPTLPIVDSSEEPPTVDSSEVPPIVDSSEEDDDRWDAIHNHIQRIHDKVDTIHDHVVADSVVFLKQTRFHALFVIVPLKHRNIEH